MNSILEYPNVAIIVVNYIRWDLTIECIESLLVQNYPNFHIFIVDNDSKNSSLMYIADWLKGKSTSEPVDKHRLKMIPQNKDTLQFPIPFQILTDFTQYIPNEQTKDPQVTLIQSKENLGFAGGNNLALKYAFQKKRFEYYWLVNNDAVVDKNALKELIVKAKLNKNYGLCGSLTLHYNNPQLVQCYGGGRYNPKWAIGYLYGYNQKYQKNIDENDVETKINYINGASCLIANQCIEKIGFLPETYFLYLEDVHYSVLVQRHGFRLGFSKNSIVYHRESTTTNEGKNKKSLTTEFYFHRNRILLTKSLFPNKIITVRLALFASIVKRILHLRFQSVKVLLKILLKF